MAKDKMLTVRLSGDQINKLNSMAARERRPRSDLVRELLATSLATRSKEMTKCTI